MKSPNIRLEQTLSGYPTTRVTYAWNIRETGGVARIYVSGEFSTDDDRAAVIDGLRAAVDRIESETAGLGDGNG